METDLILDTVNATLDEMHLNRLTGPHARTHGGEWHGPCPKCKMDTGNGGKDRLQVWPFRPVEGNGSYKEPCFTCRVCKSLTDSTRQWSGDLARFVQDTQGVSFGAARALLGLGETSNDTSVLLRPSTSVTGAPPEEWQYVAADVIAEAEEALWSDRGARQRKYLLNKRKLTEETCRALHFGAIPEERKIKKGDIYMAIARGVLIPEYHSMDVDGVAHKEIWSLAVRRDPDDLLIEQIDIEERGENGKPSKYKFVNGSVKGLYGFDSLQDGFPGVMIEGQLDQATVIQEGRKQFGAIAIQSVTGGRSWLWSRRLSHLQLMLQCVDPDESGIGAFWYWYNLIPPDRRFPWIPQVDMNAMLVRGENIYDYLMRGVDAFQSSVMSMRRATEVFSIHDLADTPLVIQEALTVTTTPSVVVTLEDVPDTCSMCGAEVEMYTPDGIPFCLDHQDNALRGASVALDVIDATLLPLDEESHQIVFTENNVCARCGENAVYTEGKYHFCEPDFASAQFMQEGERTGYPTFAYTPGKALVDTKNDKWVRVDKGGVLQGEEQYLDFIRTQSPASIWKAMQTLHKRRLDAEEALALRVERKVLPAERPCARQPGGCHRDYRVPVQFDRTQVLKEGETWAKSNAAYVHPAEYGMTTMTGEGERLHWCAMCVAGYFLLAFGEFLGYPEFHHVLPEYVIESGEKAWIEYATHASEYMLTFELGEVKRHWPEKWRKAQAVIAIE